MELAWKWEGGEWPRAATKKSWFGRVCLIFRHTSSAVASLMGSGGSKAAGVVSAAKRTTSHSQGPASRPDGQPQSRSRKAPAGVTEAEDELPPLPSWYKQPSSEVVKSHIVQELQGVHIKRRPVSKEEIESVSVKDDSFVGSLNQIEILEKKEMSHVIPSPEELALRGGSDSNRRKGSLPRNRGRAGSLDDLIDEQLFSVTQLKLALAGGNLGASAPSHKLTEEAWQSICRFISIPQAELHQLKSRGRRAARIGQRVQ